MNIQDWLDLLASPRDSQESSPAPHFYSISCLVLSHLYDPNSHPYMTTEKPFSSVQSLSHVKLFATPWTAVRQASLSIINSWSLLKLTSIELVMPSNHLILCRPLFLLPSVFPSIRIFSNESLLPIRWPKNWSLSLELKHQSFQ